MVHRDGIEDREDEILSMPFVQAKRIPKSAAPPERFKTQSSRMSNAKPLKQSAVRRKDDLREAVLARNKHRRRLHMMIQGKRAPNAVFDAVFSVFPPLRSWISHWRFRGSPPLFFKMVNRVSMAFMRSFLAISGSAIMLKVREGSPRLWNMVFFLSWEANSAILWRGINPWIVLTGKEGRLSAVRSVSGVNLMSFV